MQTQRWAHLDALPGELAPLGHELLVQLVRVLVQHLGSTHKVYKEAFNHKESGLFLNFNRPLNPES